MMASREPSTSAGTGTNGASSAAASMSSKAVDEATPAHQLDETGGGAEVVARVVLPGLSEQLARTNCFLSHMPAQSLAAPALPPSLWLRPQRVFEFAHAGSPKGVDVQISDDRLLVHAPGVYKLDIRWPRPVRAADAAARFARKSCTLTVPTEALLRFG